MTTLFLPPIYDIMMFIYILLALAAVIGIIFIVRLVKRNNKRIDPDAAGRETDDTAV